MKQLDYLGEDITSLTWSCDGQWRGGIQIDDAPMVVVASRRRSILISSRNFKVDPRNPRPPYKGTACACPAYASSTLRRCRNEACWRHDSWHSARSGHFRSGNAHEARADRGFVSS
jgi:hypothetical protein